MTETNCERCEARTSGTPKDISRAIPTSHNGFDPLNNHVIALDATFVASTDIDIYNPNISNSDVPIPLNGDGSTSITSDICDMSKRVVNFRILHDKNKNMEGEHISPTGNNERCDISNALADCSPDISLSDSTCVSVSGCTMSCTAVSPLSSVAASGDRTCVLNDTMAIGCSMSCTVVSPHTDVAASGDNTLVLTGTIDNHGEFPAGDISCAFNMPHTIDISHVTDTSHATNVSHIADTSHTTDVSHVTHVSHVADFSHVNDISHGTDRSHVTDVSQQATDTSQGTDISHTPKTYDANTCLASQHVNEIEPDDFISDLKSFRLKHVKNLIMGHLNVNSIRNKFSAIQDILSRALVDILSLCETKLDDSFPLAQFSVPNYKCFREDRNANGGGVMLYIRSDIPHYRRGDLEGNIDKANGVECVIVECTIRKCEKWIFVAGYKPPRISDVIFKGVFDVLCDVVLQETENIVILADFNLNHICGGTLDRLCNEFSLYNLVKSPTCDKGKNPTLIDVILVSKPRRFTGELNSPCWLSDHHNFICVSTKLCLPPELPKKIYYRSMRNFNDEGYARDLCKLRLPFLFDGRNVSSTVREFSADLCDIIDKHAPLKHKTIQNNQVVYMNSVWRKANHKRNMMRNIKDKYPSKENFEQYRRLRNESTKLGKQSKRTYFRERCDGGPKNQHFWHTIKPFLNDKHGTSAPTALLENEIVITDPTSIANIFNMYFAKLADGIGFNDPIPDDYYDDSTIENMCYKYDTHPSIVAIKAAVAQNLIPFNFSLINDHAMFKVLNSMNTKKATGFDNISSIFLKSGATYLAPHLAHYINTSIEQCQFPDVMKIAEVSPIFKKENDLLKGNFRPVSVLTALSKVFERVYANQLVEYFEKIFSGKIFILNTTKLTNTKRRYL